ncbi:MAG TPA: cupredoxin family protein [Pseudolabrys sp.]|nr:cupredoxin family protein [Pseudolabrys sp.]
MILGSVAVAHEGEHFSAGEPGEAKKPARIVPVTMKETSDGKMLFFPNSIEVRKGEQVRFVITNAGAVTHEFVLASKTDNDKHAALMQKYPDMEHDDPNGKTLQPGQKAEMIWKFSKAGTFEFACLIPGHREAGMLGSVNVK